VALARSLMLGLLWACFSLALTGLSLEVTELLVVNGDLRFVDAFFNKSRLTYFCLVGWLDVLKLPVYSGFTGLCLMPWWSSNMTTACLSQSVSKSIAGQITSLVAS